MFFFYSDNPLLAVYHLTFLFLPAELVVEVTDACDGQMLP